MTRPMIDPRMLSQMRNFDPRALQAPSRDTRSVMASVMGGRRSGSLRGRPFGGDMPDLTGLHGTWLEPTYQSISSGTSWTMPSSLWASTSGHFFAYVLVNVDYLSTSGGNIDIKVQSAPVMSTDANAWTTVASVSTVTTTGPQLLKLTRIATNPMSGLIRIVITANTAAVTVSVRADLLLKQTTGSQSLEWVQSTYLRFTGAGSTTMPADVWLDLRGHTDVFLLLDFVATSGSASDLTIKLQTAPTFSIDTNAWLDVGTTLAMSSNPRIYDGRESVTNPPMGVVRLQYTAAGALAGNLRVQALLKGA